MKKSYAIVLFIFIFSLTSTAVNEMGIFEWNTNTDTGITYDDITELDSRVTSSVDVDELESEGDTFGLFAGVQMIINALGVLYKAIKATVIIYPTLVYKLGFPPIIGAIFQGVTTVIAALAVAEFLSGRRATN